MTDFMQFEQCLQREVATAEKDKDGFIKEFSEADYDAVVGGWKVSCTLYVGWHSLLPYCLVTSECKYSTMLS